MNIFIAVDLRNVTYLDIDYNLLFLAIKQSDTSYIGLTNDFGRKICNIIHH